MSDKPSAQGQQSQTHLSQPQPNQPQPNQPQPGQAAPGQSPQAAVALPNAQQLQADAQNMGVDAGTFMQLLMMFGPLVAQALLRLFQQKQALQQKAQAGQPALAAANTGGQPQQVGPAQQPQNFGLDLDMARHLAAILLSQHRNEILGFLDQAEAQLLDTVIAKLQGQQVP